MSLLLYDLKFKMSLAKALSKEKLCNVSRLEIGCKRGHKAPPLDNGVHLMVTF